MKRSAPKKLIVKAAGGLVLQSFDIEQEEVNSLRLQDII
jgi:hypothetical protein